MSVQVESGTLEVARVLDPRRRSSTLPVVGGTGVYAGASGIVRFKPKGGGGTLTFRLLG